MQSQEFREGDIVRLIDVADINLMEPQRLQASKLIDQPLRVYAVCMPTIQVATLDGVKFAPGLYAKGFIHDKFMAAALKVKKEHDKSILRWATSSGLWDTKRARLVK